MKKNPLFPDINMRPLSTESEAAYVEFAEPEDLFTPYFKDKASARLLEGTFFGFLHELEAQYLGGGGEILKAHGPHLFVPKPLRFEVKDVTAQYQQRCDNFRVFDFGRSSYVLTHPDPVVFNDGKSYDDVMSVFEATSPSVAESMYAEIIKEIRDSRGPSASDTVRLTRVLEQGSDFAVNRILREIQDMKHDILDLGSSVSQVERALAQKPQSLARVLDIRRVLTETPHRTAANAFDGATKHLISTVARLVVAAMT